MVFFFEHVGDLSLSRREWSSQWAVKVDFFYTFYCNYSMWLKITIWFFFKASIVSLTINTIHFPWLVTHFHKHILCKALSWVPWAMNMKTWQQSLSLIGVRLIEIAIIIFHYLKAYLFWMISFMLSCIRTLKKEPAICHCCGAVFFCLTEVRIYVCLFNRF